MNDKDRTLKALEDMKESMAYAVRRRATADVVSLEAQVLDLRAQLERVERETKHCDRAKELWMLIQNGFDDYWLSNGTNDVLLAEFNFHLSALPSAKTAQTEQQKG